ncbi:MAG: PQQ-like beta-propeller repeat protein [Bryobacterales bacterium]|nr:PQQ-like beta-propeller repeat protein [Bryobacterales bacterium]
MLTRRAFGMLPAARALAAVDFPQWRGPNRDGVVGSVKLPAAWPDKLTRKWRMAVGEGHASPVMSGGRLYVFARQSENEILRAVEPATGKVIWTSSNAAPYTVNPAATKHRKGPKSTPLVIGGRVVALGISGILSVHDAATGKVLWRKEFGKEFRETSPLYGAAMSPIVVDGLVIAHVGGDGGGALTAFDLAAGAVRWKWSEDGPGYASPVAVTVAGKRQVVTQSEKSIVSVDPKDGKVVWKIPFTTPYAQNSVTPLVFGDKLILSGLSNGTMCVDSAGKVVWHNKEVGMYMNSPVVAGETIYGFTNRNRGQYFAMSARDGRLLWSSEPRKGDNAAILLAGDLLFLLNTDAELIVAKASPASFQVVKTYAVAESETWAHPLVLTEGIVVKDFEALTLWTV